MKILFLCPFIPWPLRDGGRIRVYQLMRAAAAAHEVHLLALVEELEDRSAADHLRAEGFEVELVPHRRSFARAVTTALRRGRSVYHQMFASEGFATALGARLLRESYDVVQCEYAYMAQYAVSSPGVSWVLDEHNIEFRLSQSLAATRPRWDAFYRLYAEREWRMRRQEELRACRQMDRVLTVSEEDRHSLQGEARGATIEVIPNGVDTCHFVPADRRIELGTEVVFVGDMAYRPNSDGILWLCREVWPQIRAQLPAARLRVVGRPGREGRKLEGVCGIEVVGCVPEVLPYLQYADVLAVPLHSGSGTRFKVLEALAVGGAVVSTTVGHEGLDVTPGRELLTADSPDNFATAVVKLLRQPELRAALGAAGRRLVERRYSWRRITAELASVYESTRLPQGERAH